MSKLTAVLTTLALLTAPALAPAVTVPGAMAPRALVDEDTLARFSIGFDYELVRRHATMGQREDELNAHVFAGFLGYDALPWLTLFLTGGAADARMKQMTEYDDMDLKWSAGAGLNLWQYMIENPSYLAGRLSFRPVIEYASYSAKTETGGGFEWSDFSVVLPFGYEMFEDDETIRPAERISVNFWGGPAVSVLDGTIETPGGDVDFEADDDVGAVGGVDIYISRWVSLGAKASYFEETSITGSIRYHF